nr:PDZ and LIM domain protein Zasp isoform X2 [Halyomorpha halys]
MAQVISVRLSRTDNSPWGIRLQGGKDFGQPLLIQKVNGGSLAERAGLLVGDAVIRVNNVDVSDMRHKEAQDTIVRAGNNFEVTVQRGSGSTWKPHVSPVGGVPTPGKASPMAPVTKTSLAATKAPSTPIGSGHNLSPKPFGAAPQVNGDAAVKAIVNKQYNTPVGMYSEEIIAETLSAQAEVLVGGAIGVNFMKNEKTYDSQKSEVFKMVQEVDKEPRTPEPGSLSSVKYFSQHSHAIGGRATSPRPLTPLAKEMGAEPSVPTPPTTSVQDNPPCSSCGKHIVGVFVRIKDKNLHVECFKCATCGTSLKNVGYYNINNKLYCDIHAKMVARQNPPAPNLEPVTVPPGGRAPASAFQSQISSTPSFGSQSPQPGTLAPLPFHAPRTTTSHVTPRLGTQTQTFAPSGPKPFGSTVPSVPSSIFTPSSVAPPTSAPTNVAPPPAPPSSGITKPYSVHDSIVNELSETLTELETLQDSTYRVCNICDKKITRGPFITALGKIWCPEHFVCVNAKCSRPLQDIGFVEEADGLYCEFCFEKFLAPTCDKCNSKIKGDCLNAIGKHFHPECFACAYCGKLFGNNPFFLEDSLPYCEADWNELFTTKCFSCGFPIEAGDRWVEALNNNYHSQCFNCTMCKKNLEGQSFYAKAGRPFCKNHAR